MKKWTLMVILLVIVLAVALCACGSDDEKSDGQPSGGNNYVQPTGNAGSSQTDGKSGATGGDNGNKTIEPGPTVVDPLEEECESLLAGLNKATREDEYADLFALYQDCVDHAEEHGDKCSLLEKTAYTDLLKEMLYGKWMDDDSNYISYQYIYENYDNTQGNTWYGTNLPSSKISGNTYYYYIKTDENNVVIGYQDKLTEEQVDNFVITFEESGISVYNKNNKIKYELDMVKDYNKVVKGNARKAYIYIAKQIFDFKYPASVTVTACEVSGDIVYATIQAQNGFGGTNNTTYMFYELSGKYYISESSKTISTNVNLSELNSKLQAYVATGG